MTTQFNTSRALSTSSHLDTDRSSSWLGNFFRPFESPLDFEDDANQVSDHYHWRYLGISCLKSDTYGSIDVSFFQVYELTTQQTHPSLLPSECSNKPPANSPTTKATTTTMKSGETSTNQLNRDHSTEHSVHLHGNYTLVISLNTQIFKPSKHQYYYIFPCDSIVETVNESPPFELFCSFYTLSSIQGLNGHLDKKLANVMPSNDQHSPPLSSSPHVTPDIKMEQGISHRPASKDDLSIAHVSLSGISKELHSIIKDTVAVFETAYRNMMQLMKLHTEGVSNRHSELLVVGGTNGPRAKKSPNEGKSGTNKRKGSSQQLPAFASDRVYTTTMTGKAKSTPLDIFESSAMPPKSVSTSPPSSSPIATTSSSESAPPVMVSVPSLSTSKNNNSQRHSAANGRKCIYCGATKTPMWRRGPQGAGTLCNACGVKWKNGKILCGKSSELGSTSAAAKASVTNVSTTKVQQKKKRKQQGESKIQQDKRVKIRKQLQYQQSRHDFSDSSGDTPREFFSHNMVDMHTDEDINIIADDDSDDDEDIMEADEHITHLRHPSTDKGQLQHSMSPYQLSPRAPHSRSRSMTTSMASGYRQYQQQQPQQQSSDSSVLHEPQQQSPLHPLLVQQYQHHQHHHHQQQEQQQQHHHRHQEQQKQQQQQESQHQQHQQRPRRHTADVTVLDRAPWGEYPLSMGVDAVEAATVLTLLKRS